MDGLHAQTAADLTGNKFSVFQTVTVADEHRLTGGVDGGGLHPVYQRRQRRLTAPGLADRDQAALVIHMHDRLDGQHGAEQGGGGVDPAAPLQVVQIVHREPVADAALDLLGKGLHLVDGFPLFLLLSAEIHEQSLPQRGAEGVHRQDLRVGKFVLQLLRGNDGGLVGGGEGGGKADAQDVLSGFQDLPHLFLKFPHVDGGGGGQLAGADPLVELMEADLPAIQIVAVGAITHLQAQR